MPSYSSVAAGVLAVLLGAAPLSGCGGEDQEDYCRTVTDRRDELSENSATGGAAGLLASQEAFEDLAGSAPADIRDEWDTITRALEEFRQVIEETGVDPATYDVQQPPEDLPAADRSRLREAASGLVTSEVTAAMDAVDQQVRDVCHTPLSI